MDEIIIIGLVLLGVAGLLLVMPIIALVTARSARREVDRLRIELQTLRRSVEAAKKPAPPAPAEPKPEPPPEPKPISFPELKAAISIPTPVSVSAPDPLPVPAPLPASVPGPVPVAKSSLEEKIALVWFTRIGALITLLGAAYFFKYAVDNEWVGPLGRVAIGVLAGLGAIVYAEATRAKSKPVFIQAVLGVGLAILLFSAYASSAFYHLVPTPAAFGAFFVVTLFGGALSMHHRAQAVLVFSMIGAFLAPVLLSTGEDRPIALFGYLLVVTSLSNAVSLRMDFRVTLGIAVVGNALLFGGWYARYFDAHPAPEQPSADLPLAELQGPYFPMANRAGPLGSVAAFFLQGLATWYAARRKHAELKWPVWLLVPASVLAHVGFAALLYDRPLVLGGLLAALGVASTVLFHREKRSELLVIPLFASFAVLCAVMQQNDVKIPLPMLGVLGVWGLIYAAGFLKGRLGGGQAPQPVTLVFVGLVGVGLAILSGFLLGDRHPHLLGSVLTVLSVGYGLLAALLGIPILATAAVGASFVFFVNGMPSAGTSDPRFIAIAGAWAAVYLLAACWDLFRRKAPPVALRIATVSMAGLGFAFLAEAHTEESQRLLRAAILAGVGIVDLAIGAALLKQQARRPASVLLGQALALFAGAVALLFSGATITIIWAVLAAVVVVLACSDRDPLWLAGGVALFIGVLYRLLAYDLWEPELARQLFFATGGATGALRARFGLNARAYALLAGGLALLVSARAAAKIEGTGFRRAAQGFLSFGHLALLALVVSEVQTLVLTIPPFPGRLSPDEFSAFQSQYLEAVAAQRQKLMMTPSLLLALYAAVLVGIGFGARDRAHRYLGLGLFALTLGKVAVYDVPHLERVYQISVFVGVGVLLLAASSLYARFGRRLVALVRDGSIAGLFLLIAATAGAQETRFAEQRPIQGVDAPGFWRVELDPVVYRHSRAEMLDLRILGPDHRMVPYLLRDLPVAVPAQTHPATLVDPVSLPDGSLRAILDLGKPGLKHSQIRLEIDGQDFFRRTRIEISSDEQAWAKLAEGTIIFRVVSGERPSDRTVISYPVSDARYLRVTLLPGIESRPPRITGAQVAFAPPASKPVMRTIPLKLDPPTRDEKTRTTRLVFDLGEPGLPLETMALTISTPAFERRVSIGGANHQNYWAGVGGGVLFRLGSEENRWLALSGTKKQYLRVDIADGDDAPLTVTSAEVEYRAQELVFRADTPGEHRLLIGDAAASAPSYDLPAVLARTVNLTIRDASFGPLSKNLAAARDPEGPKPFSEQYAVPLAVGFGVVVVGLALWTLRLLRSAKTPT